jgi:ech hydrogenase subunit D
MTTVLPDCERVPVAALVDAAGRLHDEGWRLVTASCVRRPDDAFTVLYHFEQDERLRHLRVELGAGDAVPSIGGVHASAFLVENEMIELQGLRVRDLAIDYGGRLYRDFDGPEGSQAPAVLLDAAAELRLDACVPLTANGREMRSTASRIPGPILSADEANGHGAHGHPPIGHGKDGR